MALKRKTPRNKNYMAWVRTLNSVVSGSNQYVVAHHVRCFGWGGIGLKPSDYRVVPLTHEEHLDLHQNGEEDFWEHHDIEPRSHIAAQMVIYLREEVGDPMTRPEVERLEEMEWTDMIEMLEDRIHNKTRFQ